MLGLLYIDSCPCAVCSECFAAAASLIGVALAAV